MKVKGAFQLSPAFRLIASIGTGALLLLSYPPFNMAWLAWFALVPFLWVVKTSPKFRWLIFNACLTGCVWGGLFYPLLFVEGGTPLERYGGYTVITGILITFLFLFSILYRWFTSPLDRLSSWRSLGHSSLVLISVWLGLEYMFRIGAVGFSPYLGITQWQAPLLLTVASWGGVHAVSALVIGGNSLVFHGLIRWVARRHTRAEPRDATSPWPGPRFVRSGEIVVGIVFGGLLLTQGFFQAKGPAPGAAHRHMATGTQGTQDTQDAPDAQFDSWVAVLVQPGFTPAEYYDAAVHGWEGHERMFAQVLNRTRVALQQYSGSEPAVVFWPETTLHIDLLMLAQHRESVAALAREFDVGMVLGIPRLIDDVPVAGGSGRQPWSPLGIRPTEYNSARIITPDGTQRAVYDKIYVIPIAEAQYAPGRNIEAYYPLAGPGGLGPALGVGICSDVIEPHHARTAVRAGAHTLHYLSALSRIGGLVELERAFLSMRAAEHRVYVTQTATTGPSVVVDPFGRVVEETETTGPDVRVVSLPTRGETTTLYTRRGDWPVAMSALVLMASGIGGLYLRLHHESGEFSDRAPGNS